MKNLICAMSIALAAGVALADDLTVSEDTTITNAATYGTITFENNATLTLKQGDKQYLTFGTMSGTGKIVMDGRAYIRSNASDVDGVIPETVTIEVKGKTSWANRLSGYTKQLIVKGPLVGTGDVYLNYSGSGNNGVTLAGDNTNFEGTVYLDSNGNARNKFGAAQAGGTKMRFVNLGNAADNGSVTFNGDSEGKTTLCLGSVYTSSRSMANYPWRFKQSGIVTLETGHLNRTDDRISIRMGEKDNNDNGRVRIRKVGTGTLELWNPGHRQGTFIDNGTVLVTSDKALNLYNGNPVITFGSDTNDTVNVGGTLKYGEDPAVLDEASQPTPVTTDYSSLIKNSNGPIAIDTNGKDITYATSLAASNVGGLIKLGEGTLDLSSVDSLYTGKTIVSNGTLKLKHVFSVSADGIAWPTYEYETLEGANLEVTMFVTGDKRPGTSFSEFPNGTVVNIANEKIGGMPRVTTVSGFKGTINFLNTNAMAGAHGFVGVNKYGSDDIDWGVTGEPSSATKVFVIERKDGSTLTANCGELRVPSANAQISIAKSAATINIGALNTYSYLNGQFVDNKVTFNKNGTGKLTIGQGFAVVDGSTFAVNAGTLELESGVSQPSYMTIADNVTLCGEGTFGAVDLSKHDLILPTEVDKTKTYTILTATSVSGDYTQNVKDALAALGDKWRLRKVTSDGTTKIVLTYVKSGLTIVIK